MSHANDRTTAADAYASAASDIARLLDVLQEELRTHKEAAASDPRNWGRAGDLTQVRSDLIDLVSFLSGNDRIAINEFLSETN